MPPMPPDPHSLFDLPDFDWQLPIPPPPVHKPFVVRGYLPVFRCTYDLCAPVTTLYEALRLLSSHVRFVRCMGWTVEADPTRPHGTRCVCPYDAENGYTIYIEELPAPLHGKN